MGAQRAVTDETSLRVAVRERDLDKERKHSAPDGTRRHDAIGEAITPNMAKHPKGEIPASHLDVKPMTRNACVVCRSWSVSEHEGSQVARVRCWRFGTGMVS